MPESLKYLQSNLVLDNGHLLVQVLKRSGIRWKRISPQGIWDHIADKMLLEFAESGCPIFRCNNSIVQRYSQEQGRGKLSIHSAADQETIETIFRIIVFASQLSLYGAVANMCEEFEFHQDRSGQLDVLMGQSIVLSEIKAEVPLQNEIPSHQNVLWQQYEERIKLFSQESKVSKFCMYAGFVHVVEVGLYFMTKDTGDNRQFRAVACREYTVPRDDESSQPIRWIHGNTRIGLVLEVTTSYLWGKYGVEIRIWSVAQDTSQSWVRISHGANKFVVDSNYNNTEVPADLLEEQESQSSVRVVAARSKAKAKPQKRETVDTPSIIPMHERKWIDIEPAGSSLSAYEVSKKMINLLRHNQTVQRKDDGEVPFWRIKFHLRNQLSQVQLWSDERWNSCLAALIFQEQLFTSALFSRTLRT